MRSKGLGALVLSAAMIGLAAPASALAAKPAVTTGGAGEHHVLERAAQRIRAIRTSRPTAYFFQYGTTIALGAQTADDGRRRR